MSADNDDDGIQMRRRSFVKRLNIVTEPRPKSLITYDSNAPPLSPSPGTGSSQTKAMPPVLARARQNLTSTGGGEYSSNVVVYSTNNTNTNVIRPSVDGGGGGPNRRASLGPIEDLVLCSVCLERLKNPKMLKCQHTFCLVCLQSVYYQRKKLECPTCRQEQQNIQDINEIDALPTNLYIASLLKVLRGSSTSPTPLNQIEHDFEHRCIKCQTIVEADNFQKCRHCKQNFCNVCWNDHMTALNDQLIKLGDQLNSAKEKIYHKLDEYKDRMVSLKNHIHGHIEYEIQSLRNQEKSLFDQLQKINETENKITDPLIEEINQIKMEVTAKQMDRSSTDPVTLFMILHKRTSELFQKINKYGERKIDFDKENLKIEIHSGVSDEPDLNSPNPMDGGGAESDDNVFDDDAERDSDELRNGATNKTQFESYETLKNYYKNKTFRSKFVWTKCARPAGVGFAPWTHMESGLKLLYVAGSDSQLIYGIETKKGRIVHRISHEDMIFPNSLCFMAERREIFVTDKWKHCIFVFSENGELLRSLCSKGDREGDLRSPEGIALGPNNTIYVCDTGNDRIQCLDILTGKVLLQFGSIENYHVLNAINNRSKAVVTDLKAPTAVQIIDNHIIVLDSGNRRVKIFTNKGEKISEFGTFGTGNGQFKYPETLTIDQYGFIYVGDGGNAKVEIFEPSGNLLNSFGVRGTGTGKFGWVSGMSITNDGRCIVSDYKNHTVQIFS